MGRLIFGHNLALDGCVDHLEGIADDETFALYTRLLEEPGAMLRGRMPRELVEGSWPAVARGERDAPPAIRARAVLSETGPGSFVSTTRTDSPWPPSPHQKGDCASPRRGPRTGPPRACSSPAGGSRWPGTGWTSSTRTG